MTKEEAEEVLVELQNDFQYVNFTGDDEVCLDGYYSKRDLEAVITLMKECV